LESTQVANPPPRFSPPSSSLNISLAPAAALLPAAVTAAQAAVAATAAVAQGKNAQSLLEIRRQENF
jgi:hypothetical protein